MNRMKPFLTLAGLVAFISLACNAPLREPGPAATMTAPSAVTPTLQATIRPTADADPATATPGVSSAPEPTFTNLRFAPDPEATTKSDFDAGTEEVFALWEYASMSVDDTMKRIWTRNGEEWLVREATWDFDKYGAEGTVKDISVYDFTGGGLEPGHYSLMLYINEKLQAEADFRINVPETAVQVPEPNGDRVALVLGDGRLVVQETDGSLRELAQATEVADLDWFPEGEHIVYVERDRSEQLGTSTIGIKHALWLVALSNGEPRQLGSFEEDLHTPQVSPDGRAIALISGTGYGDACFVDRHLRIMILGDDRQRTALYGLEDFAGAPTSKRYWLFPANDGAWQSDTEFEIHLDAYCLAPELTDNEEELQLPGIYRLNIASLEATRVSDLP